MKFFFLGASLLLSVVAFSQNMLGISTSRYGGTNRLYINPALAADSPSKFFLNVGTGNAHVDNNYVRYQAPFSLLRLVSGYVPAQYKNPNGTVKFESEYTSEILNGKPKNGTIWGEIRGPSVLFKTGEGSAIAFTSRFRAIGQVTGASEALLSAIRASLNEGGILFGIPSTNNQFNASTSTYSELGLTYAFTLLEGDGRKLLLGATGKLLLGYNGQQLVNRGLTYQIVPDFNQSNNTYLEVTKLEATLAYTNFLQNRPLTPRTLLSTDAPGRGAGFDVGLTYVSQYDLDSPAFQLGIAVTDVGSIKYSGPSYTYTGTPLTIGNTPVRFQGSDFDNLGSTSEIIQVIQAKLGPQRNPDALSFRQGLPTSLNLTLDYQLPDGLGINVAYLQDMRPAQDLAIRQPTLLAVTPRYDKRWLSIAVPLVYLNGGISAGGSLRIGPGWIGTENFLGLVGNVSNGVRPRGLDVYAGVAFGLGRVRDDY